jgi:hypothetical protein
MFLRFCYKTKKKIKFDEYVYIDYIPSSIKDRNMLWWNNTELYLFKESCILEIKNLLNRHPNMNYRDAIKLLYQPGNMTIIYDESNFVD